jgi:signal transduction histidine kinase
VRGFVQGQVAVESELGAGTTFRLRIPLMAADVAVTDSVSQL